MSDYEWRPMLRICTYNCIPASYSSPVPVRGLYESLPDILHMASCRGSCRGSCPSRWFRGLLSLKLRLTVEDGRSICLYKRLPPSPPSMLMFSSSPHSFVEARSHDCWSGWVNVLQQSTTAACSRAQFGKLKEHNMFCSHEKKKKIII